MTSPLHEQSELKALYNYSRTSLHNETHYNKCLSITNPLKEGRGNWRGEGKMWEHMLFTSFVHVVWCDVELPLLIILVSMGAVQLSHIELSAVAHLLQHGDHQAIRRTQNL